MHLKGETALVNVDPSVSIYTYSVPLAPFPPSRISAVSTSSPGVHGKGGRTICPSEGEKNNRRIERGNFLDLWGRRERVGGDLLLGHLGEFKVWGESDVRLHPPRCWSVCQTEIEVPEDFSKTIIQNKIHIFDTHNPKISILHLPKRQHNYSNGNR